MHQKKMPNIDPRYSFNFYIFPPPNSLLKRVTFVIINDAAKAERNEQMICYPDSDARNFLLHTEANYLKR